MYSNCFDTLIFEHWAFSAILRDINGSSCLKVAASTSFSCLSLAKVFSVFFKTGEATYYDNKLLSNGADTESSTLLSLIFYEMVI